MQKDDKNANFYHKISKMHPNIIKTRKSPFNKILSATSSINLCQLTSYESFHSLIRKKISVIVSILEFLEKSYA